MLPSVSFPHLWIMVGRWRIETGSSPVDLTNLAADNYTSRCLWLRQRMQ